MTPPTTTAILPKRWPDLVLELKAIVEAFDDDDDADGHSPRPQTANEK